MLVRVETGVPGNRVSLQSTGYLSLVMGFHLLIIMFTFPVSFNGYTTYPNRPPSPAGPAMATASRVVTRMPTAKVRKRAFKDGLDGVFGGNHGQKNVRDGCTIF